MLPARPRWSLTSSISDGPAFIDEPLAHLHWYAHCQPGDLYPEGLLELHIPGSSRLGVHGENGIDTESFKEREDLRGVLLAVLIPSAA